MGGPNNYWAKVPSLREESPQTANPEARPSRNGPRSPCGEPQEGGGYINQRGLIREYNEKWLGGWLYSSRRSETTNNGEGV